MDSDDDDVSGILNEPEFQRYYEMLHGPYIAALMSRADARRRGGAVDVTAGASTLSDEVREAFAESQANLAWTPEESERSIEAAGKHRDDSRDAEDSLVASELSSAPDDDFSIPEPSAPETPREPDDDFEVARAVDSDFGPRDDIN